MIAASHERRDDRNDVALPCLACLGATDGWLATPMPALDDAEGSAVPPGLPPITDAHVHVFPPRVFEALWRWFDRHGWPIRYRLHAEAVLAFQLARGVSRVVTLVYAHKAGMARSLNRFAADVASGDPRIVALGTVFPGEADQVTIVDEAFAMGLAGLKLHCHVQAFAPDDPALDPIYEACERASKPIVVHAGREPKSPAYPVDTHLVCAASRIESVLRRFPRLKLCVPHLGADEIDTYVGLLARHDNLFLDTTMALADYFPTRAPMELLARGQGRILFGTDFPNLPYAWDRELRRIDAARLVPDLLESVLGGAADRLFGSLPSSDASPLASRGGPGG